MSNRDKGNSDTGSRDKGSNDRGNNEGESSGFHSDIKNSENYSISSSFLDK